MNSPQASEQQQSMQPDEPTIEIANCATHGEFEQKVFSMVPGMRPVRSVCPKCAEERAAAQAEMDKRQKAAARRLDVENLIRDSGIPLRFRESSFTNYEPETKAAKLSLAVCKRYAEAKDELREGRSLVLTGGPGTGKTHLACAIARHVIEEYVVSVRFITVADMLRQIKETYRKDATVSEAQVISAFIGYDLLVLDEIGVQVGSEHEKLLLFEVLNGRYQDLAPTILVSNLSADELEQFLGHRVMDRYRECGVILAFDWSSYRGKRAA